MQSSKVPCWPGTVPWLRGTISYQAPARARGRSAITGTGMLPDQVGAREVHSPRPSASSSEQDFRRSRTAIELAASRG